MAGWAVQRRKNTEIFLFFHFSAVPKLLGRNLSGIWAGSTLNHGRAPWSRQQEEEEEKEAAPEMCKDPLLLPHCE